MNNKIDAEVLAAGGTTLLEALKLRLATQIAPRRWRSSLELLANHVEAGQPLDEVFDRRRLTLPDDLRCLIGEALQVPDPTKLILDVLRAKEGASRNGRELWALIAYPAVLFGAALGVGVLFSFAMRHSIDLSWVDQFQIAGTDRMRADLNDQHNAIIGLAMVFAWLVAVMATIAVAAPRWAWISVVGGMLLVGRPLRWIALQELLQRLEMFLGQGVSAVAAAEAVSRSFSRSGQAVVAEAVAQRIGGGMLLGNALCASMLSDGLCRPALRLLDMRGAGMTEALSETSELIGRLAEQRCRTLAIVLPAFLLVLVGTVLWSTLCTYILVFVPLVSLLNSLA